MFNLHSGVPESPYWLRYLMFAARTKARQSVFDYKYFPNVVYPKRQQQIDFANDNEEQRNINVAYGNSEMPLNNLVRKVIPSKWCKAIKSSDGVRLDLPYWRRYKEMKHWWYPALSKGNTYYKFLWWGREQNRTYNDIYAMGVMGQFVYVSTENDVVIVRQGTKWGIDGWWPEIFEDLANRI